MTEQQLLDKYNKANKLAYSGKESEAFKEFQSLARNEQHIPSMRTTALYHLNGKGTDKSVNYAIYWYKRVADATNTAIDCYVLATVYKSEKNYTDALKYFLLASEKGHVQATYEVGNCYKLLDKPLLEESLRYYEQASNLGCEDATLELAILYRKGIGNNKSKAIELFKSILHEVPEASYELALCYFNSHGTQRDYYEAIRLFKEASNQGVSKATTFLEKLNEFESKRIEIKYENYNKALEIIKMLYSKNPYSYSISFWENLISKRNKRGILGSWDKLDITIKKLTDGNGND